LREENNANSLTRLGAAEEKKAGPESNSPDPLMDRLHMPVTHENCTARDPPAGD
jgi:hypothetical protein